MTSAKNKRIIGALTAERGHNVPRKFKPISWKEFPKNKKVIEGTNCLAFALGIKNPKRKHRYVLKMTAEPMETIFLKKVKKLGFNPQIFKQIDQDKEKEKKGYVIRVYGFEPEETEDGIMYDFHVIRREPNGQWVHKPGFDYLPRKVTERDWRIIFEKFGNKFISFAIET